MNAMSQSTAPSEKNQNGAAVHKRSVMVARAKTVKNVWVRIAQTGKRKTPTTNFTQRVGIINLVIVADPRLVGTTYGGTFTPRDSLRPRTIPDRRFIDCDPSAKGRSRGSGRGTIHARPM